MHRLAQVSFYAGDENVGEWQRLSEGPFFRCARLDCALRCTRGALLRCGEGEKLLALPYAPDAPFPLCELFCFARVCCVMGRWCVVYCLDEQNSPIFRENLK